MLLFVNFLDEKVGGVEQIIVNTAIELSRKGEKCKIYSSKLSYSYVRLKELLVNYIHIDKDVISLKKLHKYVDGSDVIILTHIYNNELLYSLRKINNKIVFYSVHPETFLFNSRVMNALFPMKTYLNEFLDLMDKKNALFFMCGETQKSILDAGVKLTNQTYIPVPVFSYIAKQKERPGFGFSKDQFVITYLGRGNAEWKVYPIIQILSDLAQLDLNIEVELHILTCSKELINKMVSTYLPNNTITIKFQIGMMGEDLDNYLYKYSDLHIAMGTSALEGGKLGIPTILVDGSHNIFPKGYLYRWLYEAKNYALGRFLNRNTTFEGTPLQDKIQILQNEVSWKEIGYNNYNYVQKNHSIKTFVNLLDFAAGHSEYYIRDYLHSKFPMFIYKYLKLKQLITK